MSDRLRSIPEGLVKLAFEDPVQPRGRYHFYSRVWEVLAKAPKDICLFPLEHPVTAFGVAAGIIIGQDSLNAPMIGGIAGGVMGELFEQIHASKY